MILRTNIYDYWIAYRKIIVVLVSLLVLSSCRGKSQDEVHYLIGIAHADLSEDWQRALDMEIRSQIKDIDNVDFITTNANGSTYKQVKDLQTLVDYGVDLIIVTPNDNIVMKREIKKVFSEIPVIVMNRELSGNDYSMFIGPDFYDIGRMMGEQLISHTDGENANVIELKGPFNDMSVAGMTKGFHQSIRQYKNIQLYGEFAADWKRDDAMNWYLESYKTRPKANVVVAHNQAMAEGLRDARMQLEKEHMTYFAAEAIVNDESSLREAFEHGFTYMVKWQLGGIEAVHYALDILKGSGSIPETVILNNYSINKDNIETFIENQNAFTPKSINKLGLVHTGLGPWEMSQMESLEVAVQSYNIDLQKRYIDTSLTIDEQQTEQKNAVYELMDMQVDAIILSPVASNGWREVVEVSKLRDIPIIIINNSVNEMEMGFNMFIGYDGLEEGELMAGWIVDSFYGEEDVYLAVVGGTSTNLAHRERMEGIENIADEYSRISVINNWKSGEESIEELNQFLDDNKNINVVLVLDENLISETQKVVEEHEKKIGRDIKLLCFGDLSAHERLLMAKQIDCMVGRSAEIGSLILESVEKMFQNLYSPKEILIANDVVSY